MGYNIQPSSSSTNRKTALIIDHQLDLTKYYQLTNKPFFKYCFKAQDQPCIQAESHYNMYPFIYFLLNTVKKKNIQSIQSNFRPPCPSGTKKLFVTNNTTSENVGKLFTDKFRRPKSQKEAAVFLAAGLRSRAPKNLMVCPIATGEIMAKLLVNRSFPSEFKNRQPVPGVQIVERGRKIHEEKKTRGDQRGKGGENACRNSLTELFPPLIDCRPRNSDMNYKVLTGQTRPISS